MVKSSANSKPSSAAWSDGVAQLNDAIRHHVTASRLLWAGALAVGASAAAYFWDAKRRTDFLAAAETWRDNLMKPWSDFLPDQTTDLTQTKAFEESGQDT